VVANGWLLSFLVGTLQDPLLNTPLQVRMMMMMMMMRMRMMRITVMMGVVVVVVTWGKC
jgi:hypothetical protein